MTKIYQVRFRGYRFRKDRSRVRYNKKNWNLRKVKRIRMQFNFILIIGGIRSIAGSKFNCRRAILRGLKRLKANVRKKYS